MYALTNAIIYDYKNFINDGYIIFDQKIIDIGHMNEYIKNETYQEIDCHQHIVIPGLISGHTHLYSTFARGMNVPFNPDDFMGILKQLWWKMDHFLDKDMIFSSALMGGIDQLKNGTTTLIDHHASYLVKGSLDTIYHALVEKLGLRCVLAFETSDRFSLKDAIQENVDFIRHKHQDASGLFGMHASLSLSDKSLELIEKEIQGAGIHIHVAESLLDEETCLRDYGMRVVERLDKYHLINDQSLLVHCTHINEKEMDIIKARGATIAVNPTSNLNNAVGISKVRQFLEKGIRVIVGNDGLIQSQPLEYMNTYYLSHLKNQSPTGFSLDEVKALMINTYAYTNDQLGVQLGNFEKGAEADILVLPYKAYTPLNKENVFGHLFFGLFPNFHPKMVYLKGKCLINNYQLVNDYEKDYNEALKLANQLWRQIEKEGENIEFKNKF